MAFDSNLPVDHSPIVSAELRDQLNALKALIDAQQATIADLQQQIYNRAFMAHLTILDTDFHNPPTLADLEVIRNYINDMASQLQGGF
jgi:2'-5' RNA ligase